MNKNLQNKPKSNFVKNTEKFYITQDNKYKYQNIIDRFFELWESISLTKKYLDIKDDFEKISFNVKYYSLGKPVLVYNYYGKLRLTVEINIDLISTKDALINYYIKIKNKINVESGSKIVIKDKNYEIAELVTLINDVR